MTFTPLIFEIRKRQLSFNFKQLRQDERVLSGKWSGVFLAPLDCKFTFCLQDGRGNRCCFCCCWDCRRDYKTHYNPYRLYQRHQGRPPEDVNNLQENLNVLKVVLDQLVETETQFPTKSRREGSPSAIKIALNSCKRALRRILDELVNPIQERLNAGGIEASWARVRTATMVTTIRNHKELLNSSKMDLVLALAADENLSGLPFLFFLHVRG